MPKNVQVALAFALSEPHQVRILRGIEQFAEKRGNWAFTFSPEHYGSSLAALKHWPGDGVLATITTKRELEIAREMKLPIVNLSGALRETGFPRVMVDQEAMGRIAADHLLKCGFRNFGYFGVQRVWSSHQRKTGFARRVKQAGWECSVLETPSSPRSLQSAQDWFEPLDQWLRSLPLPLGILASIDLRGGMIVDACARLGLRVPDDVAVVGIDNNEVFCEMIRVPLTSVSRSDMEVGYKAAATLARMIAGESCPTEDLLIAPDRVVTRRSTDIVAVSDAEVATAVRYVQEHVDEPFGIERLVQIVGRSRRWLTEHFRECLACTPYEFICRARVERAKSLLLAEEKLPLHEIARRCGFSETRNLRTVFERLTGERPAYYRENNRCESPRSKQRTGSGSNGSSADA
ncbi:MAG: DNA-binding transcriptional regulator [Pirellulales bacterium]|nr:DNA-binding transcriptional regulator [Pirellulales bacterium]